MTPIPEMTDSEIAEELATWMGLEKITDKHGCFGGWERTNPFYYVYNFEPCHNLNQAWDCVKKMWTNGCNNFMLSVVYGSGDLVIEAEFDKCNKFWSASNENPARAICEALLQVIMGRNDRT